MYNKDAYQKAVSLAMTICGLNDLKLMSSEETLAEFANDKGSESISLINSEGVQP